MQDGWGKFSYKNTTSSTKYIEAYTNINFWKNIIKLNTEYTIIAEWRNTNLNSGDSFAILDNNSYSIFKRSLIINSSDGTSGVKIQKFTTKNSFDGIRFLFRSFMAIASGNTASIELRVALIEGDTTETEVKVENQEFVFPLQEGQVLHEEDYTEEDGIHNKRITKVFDGTETGWAVNTNATNEGCSHFRYNNYPNLNVESSSTALLCSHFKRGPIDNENYINDTSGSNILYFGIDNNIIGVTDSDDNNAKLTKWENWLAEQYANGTPVTVETRLKEETITPYTDEQKQVYDEIVKTAKTYKTVTNIFSTNEISPKFEVEYRQDIKSLINNVSQAVLNNA